jgi:hypothetical protein
MDGAHALIIVMGTYPSWEISPGVDTIQNLAGLPADFNGGIWTNQVQLISPAVKNSSGPWTFEPVKIRAALTTRSQARYFYTLTL